jgi:hypothetical protein
MSCISDCVDVCRHTCSCHDCLEDGEKPNKILGHVATEYVKGRFHLVWQRLASFYVQSFWTFWIGALFFAVLLIYFGFLVSYSVDSYTHPALESQYIAQELIVFPQVLYVLVQQRSEHCITSVCTKQLNATMYFILVVCIDVCMHADTHWQCM